MKGRKVLVTGGAGFIGSHLCRHLLKEDAEILVVDNLFTGRKELLPEGCDFVKLDIRSPKMREVIKKFDPDYVFHLAAIHYIPYCEARPEEAFDVNVIGTMNMLKGISDWSNKIFLFTSSAAVYPALSRPVSEDVEPSPIDVYGKTKLIGEELVKLTCKNAIIARIFNVYGRNDTNPHVIPEIVKQVKNGAKKIKLGNLTPVRDYIHVEDVCKAFITLLKKGINGTYNIGTGIGHSVKEIVDIVSEILNEKVEIIYDKDRARKVDREYLVADINKIKKIGWEPSITLKDGLRELLAVD